MKKDEDFNQREMTVQVSQISRINNIRAILEIVASERMDLETKAN